MLGRVECQRIKDARFAFVDVETTGLNARTCGVVEVACQIVERGIVVDSFASLVDPGHAIPSCATSIHGIGDDMVAGKPSLCDLMPTLLERCDGAVVVAHNASFDRRFLPFLADHPSACSYRLAARVVPEAPNHRNQTLRRFFRVRDPELRGRATHRALADVIVTRHVFFHCVDRYVAYGYDDRLDALYDFLLPRARRARAA